MFVATLLAALTVVLGQRIEPFPARAEAGTRVRIEARAADGSPLADLAIELVLADGRHVPLGRTDVAGVLWFTPETAGSFGLRALHGDVELLAPFAAAEPLSRWLVVSLGVPTGLVLLGLHLARLRRPRRAPTT